MDAIRNYNWKWLMESFYGVGVAVVLAVALFVLQNNPFDDSPDDFDTFAEWKTWVLLVGSTGFRAAWVAMSVATTKIIRQVVVGAGGQDPGE